MALLVTLVVILIVFVIFVEFRIGATDDFRNHIAHDANAHIGCDFNQEVIVSSDFDHMANNTAIGDNVVTAMHLSKHCLMSFLLFLLRANQKKIENNKYQHQRQNCADAAQPAFALTALTLRTGGQAEQN